MYSINDFHLRSMNKWSGVKSSTTSHHAIKQTQMVPFMIDSLTDCQTDRQIRLGAYATEAQFDLHAS